MKNNLDIFNINEDHIQLFLEYSNYLIEIKNFYHISNLPQNEDLFNSFILNFYKYECHETLSDLKHLYYHLKQIFKNKQIYVFQSALREVIHLAPIKIYAIAKLSTKIKPLKKEKQLISKDLTILDFIKGEI